MGKAEPFPVCPRMSLFPFAGIRFTGFRFPFSDLLTSSLPTSVSLLPLCQLSGCPLPVSPAQPADGTLATAFSVDILEKKSDKYCKWRLFPSY